MSDPDYDKIGEMFRLCEEHMKKKGVPTELWGLCNKCKGHRTCPNLPKKSKRKKKKCR